MTIYFVSRHPGAREWAENEGIAVDCWVKHLDLSEVRPGDRVMGTLPVHLAAAVCERGACYIHLSLELPENQRGRELSGADLERFCARLEAYEVRRLTASGGTLG